MVLVLWAAVLAVAASASLGGGDMSADRNECTPQLVGLAPCLPYVQGQAPAPAPDCCGGLHQVLRKSPKCLCLLVKDRDNPDLGLKINGSLALALPTACGAKHVNATQCAQLLHIPPGSKDAAAFSPGGDRGATAAKGNSTATTGSRAQQATSGGGTSSAATACVALTALFAGYIILLLVPELSTSAV